MAASAAFHFDAQASLLKKSATPAGTVTLTLDSVTGVDSVLWTVLLTCENSAGDWTISGSTANNATLTVPNVSNIACIIQCRVNGGTRVDPTTGVQSVGDLVKTAKVYTGTEVIVTGETTESDATYGWGPVLNAVITSGGGGGVSLSNVAPSAVGTASAGVGTDASRYDHVHAHGNQLGGTLHADASGAAAGFMTAAHYTAVNDRAEAPTVSVIPVRSSAGRLRAVSYSLETDTDGNRLIHALQADATTYDTLGARTTALSVTDGTGAYGQTYTPAAAATEVYANDITSLTSRITQAGSGAGKPRYILGGLGAAGSANGVFVSGLENGNTVLGGAHWLAAGSLVANVSDKIRLGTGTPGSMTSFLDFYRSAAGTVTIDSQTSSIVFPSHATHQVNTSAYVLLRGPEMYHDNDTVHRRLNNTTQIADEKRGTFGPISSATTTNVLSYTTTSNRVYEVEAHLVVTNDTDNEGAVYVRRAAFKNVAGVVTQIGATTAIDTFEDAGQTGLDATIDFSGTAIRVRLTTDAADTVNGVYEVDITERVQA